MRGFRSLNLAAAAGFDPVPIYRSRRHPARRSRFALGERPDSPASSISPGFNLCASSVQINPNKTKQKSLDSLGLIHQNRDFSMGYGQKIKKIDSRLRLYAKRLRSFKPLPSKAAGQGAHGFH
jgi:hypothetical protein